MKRLAKFVDRETRRYVLAAGPVAGVPATEVLGILEAFRAQAAAGGEQNDAVVTSSADAEQ